MFNKGDFHIHSTSSDGELSPREIIITAKQRGIDILSIADHNTTKGIEEAAKAGREFGISVVPSIEVSARYKNKKVHLLGYFKNNSYNDSSFQEILKNIREHNANKVREILECNIEEEKLQKYISVLEAIYLLKKYGGSVVLAHPTKIDINYINEILNLPFDGIEAKYCSNSKVDTIYYIAIAMARFSFYTAGSDFHTNKRNDTKHSLIGNPYLNKKEIKIFLKKSGALVL